MDNENNICLLTDSYKECHYKFYMPNTEYVYSYLESRVGAKFNKTMLYGLQYILKKYLEGPILTKECIDEAEKVIDKHIKPGIFNRKGWEYILEKHKGYLPIKIQAVPEGLPVDISNAIITVVNTDPNVPWLTNFIESKLMHLWYPSTVATLSKECQILIKHYLNETADNSNGIPFMLHDFGYRGSTSEESARLAGSAHLINFKGTDTIPALTLIKKYYGDTDMFGYSVQATEHSIMTSRSESGEIEVIKNILKNADDGILSLVIDSYNYQRFIKYMGDYDYIRKEVNHFLNRKPGNKIVFRPDSGDPITTMLDCLNLLSQYFGYSLNSKGYKILPDNIGVLYGDGIDYDMIRKILFSMKNFNWSSSNVIFGMGGGLHQSVNRDTQRSAFKCSSQYFDGLWHDVYKKPLDLSKMSKRGRLAVIKEKDYYKTINITDLHNQENILKDVFIDGHIVNTITFKEIIKNSYL